MLHYRVTDFSKASPPFCEVSTQCLIYILALFSFPLFLQVHKDDKLPKKICDDCMCKVELLYQFWNTTSNAEKQLLEWLGEVDDQKTETVSYLAIVLRFRILVSLRD